jgi:hypothetical protein
MFGQDKECRLKFLFKKDCVCPRARENMSSKLASGINQTHPDIGKYALQLKHVLSRLETQLHHMEHDALFRDLKNKQ